MLISILIALIIMGISFVIVLILTPQFIKILKKKGFVGRDIHKKDKPEIAEMGGVIIFISFMIGMIILSLIFYQHIFKYIAGILSLIIIAIIGMTDDILKRKKNKVGLSAITKPILCMASGLPLIIINFFIPDIYIPYLRLPFLGAARIYYVYWLFIPIAYTIFANTTNMIDVYNGILPGTSIVIYISLLISSIIVNSEIGIILSLTFLGTLIAYYYYNKNPARIFSGDTGSLLVGASIAFTIIMADLEIVGIIALLPLIINSFQTLRSIGGLKEKSEFNRPTRILEDGRLDISESDNVPLTLAGLIMVKGPITEKEAFNSFLILTIFSSILSIITSVLLIIPW
ncbi:MAG: hypothetical protein EAX96_07405 [Candidatus Lokiarchaeota archaeon]|nr:hypothetical protein [Candidatus Lokiarchaeota archaeon]